jgi:hypothetical protein
MAKLLAPKSEVVNFLRKLTKERIIMAEQQSNGTYKCQYCGVTSPKGHQRPKTWIEKHENNCPNKPR